MPTPLPARENPPAPTAQRPDPPPAPPAAFGAAADLLDQWRALRQVDDVRLGTRERILLDVVDNLSLLEQRLAPLEDKVIGLERALGDLDAATTAAISDNVDRIIALESRLADR